MKRILLAAMAAATLSSSPVRADQSPADMLRTRFQQDEQGLLNAVLSDPEQNKSFVEQASAAVAGGGKGQEAFLARWRSTLAAFARQHADYLKTHDVDPSAPTVERMVSDYERNVTQHMLAAKTPEEQASYRRRIAVANGILSIGIGRGSVVQEVRDGRMKVVALLERYISSPSVKTALDQLKELEEASRRAPRDPVPERGTHGMNEKVDGSKPAGPPPGSPDPVPVPVDPAPTMPPRDPPKVDPPVPAPARPNIALDPSLGGAPGGFTVKPPPVPVIGEGEVSKAGAWGQILKRVAPPAAGGIGGGILGFLLGGPIGALIGIAAGALLGREAGKLL